MAGKEISPDMFGTPEYDEAIKDISALLWIDENTVPSVLAYGKFDKVQSFEASVRLDKALTEHNVPGTNISFASTPDTACRMITRNFFCIIKKWKNILISICL